MENTCQKDKCILWNLFDDGACPNYFKNVFFKEGKPEERIEVEDCAPVRTMFLIQNLYERVVALQKSQEEQRNQSGQVVASLTALIESAQRRKKELES